MRKNYYMKIVSTIISYFLHIFFMLILRIKNRSLHRFIDELTGAEDEKWSRVVMRQECLSIIDGLNPERLKALEISGSYFSRLKFKEYTRLDYPEFDICKNTVEEKFDLIIAEQVFEHLLWPHSAGKNVYQMLKPNGYFVISTPVLIKVHNYPTDCTRWTDLGLKYFLAECGFPLERIKTFSWGNRACVLANFSHWVRYRRRIHSLINEPDFPYHVWGIAQK